jgi:hypothetical protein
MMQREEEEKVSFSGFRTSGRNRRRKKATSVNRPLTLSTFFFSLCLSNQNEARHSASQLVDLPVEACFCEHNGAMTRGIGI